MKKVKLKSSLFAGLASLLLFFPNFKSGDLKDIAKPYQGVYECRMAQLGAEDVLGRFERLEIEIKQGDECALYYKEKNGKKQRVNGKYHYDKEKQSITLALADFEVIKREFPLKEGVLYITVPFGSKTLTMQFEQK